MKITTKGRYAMRVMIDLAEQNGVGVTSLRAVSKRQNVSLKYLEQIMSRLSFAGLVIGARGSTGGYRLAKDASEIRAAEIIAAVEKENDSPLHEDENPKAAAFWQGLEKAVSDYLAAQTLEETVKNRRDARRETSVWIL